MLTKDQVETVVHDTITALLQELAESENGDGENGNGTAELPPVEAGTALADLGLDSLMLARIVIEVGESLGVDPFEDEDASIADLRTVGDVVRAYET